MAVLSTEELKRYGRHLLLPEIGLSGQQRLKAGSVLIVGAGGLGSPAALYLAAAGVGRIGLVDFDLVDVSNLQRQILFSESEAGNPKTEAAGRRLASLNPNVQIELHACRLDAQNALSLFSKYDVVLDASDNFSTRYLVNDACVLSGRPNVFASVLRFEGQLSVFSYQGTANQESLSQKSLAPQVEQGGLCALAGMPQRTSVSDAQTPDRPSFKSSPKKGPCYRCLFPSPPEAGAIPSCAEAGVLGAVPGVLGSMQAIEAIKILCGMEGVLSGVLLAYDALRGEMQRLRIFRDPNCPVCGDDPKIRNLAQGQDLCGIDSQAALQKDTPMHNIPEIDVRALKERLDKKDDFVLLDVREDFEYDICKIEGSRLVPLSVLQDRLDELDKDQEYVVMCKVGGRSARAVEFLMEEGFGKVSNLKGGILAWIDEIDGGLERY